MKRTTYNLVKKLSKNRDDKRAIEATVPAYEIKYKNITLIVHRRLDLSEHAEPSLARNWWVVTEPSLNLGMGWGSTRKAAIQNAKSNIEDVGVQETLELIEGFGRINYEIVKKIDLTKKL